MAQYWWNITSVYICGLVCMIKIKFKAAFIRFVCIVRAGSRPRCRGILEFKEQPHVSQDQV